MKLIHGEAILLEEKAWHHAIETANGAGELLLRRWKKGIQPSRKADGSIVTEVDQEVSEYIARQLRRFEAEYGIVDEESPPQAVPRGIQWVVDPLDGTYSYVKGDDDFGVMIGMMKDYWPFLGVCYQPARNEMTYAFYNQGCWSLTPQRLTQITPPSSLDQRFKMSAVVGMYRDSAELEALIEALQPESLTKAPTSFKILDVAKGKYNIFVCPRSTPMNIWDVCAAQACLHEVPGKITDLDGNPLRYDQLSFTNGILAANEWVYPEAYARLQKVKNLGGHSEH